MVSAADDALVLRALAPDPEKRFLDAGQMLRALEGQPVPMPPVVPPALVAGDFDVLFGGGANASVVAVAKSFKALYRLFGIRIYPRQRRSGAFDCRLDGGR